jgi:antitoxin HigA-1
VKKTYPRGTRMIPGIHPGALLREEFLPDFRMSVTQFARALGVSRQTVNELLREKRGMTAVMALRLSRLFGTSAEMWMGLQEGYDLWHAEKRYKKQLDRIKPIVPDELPAAVADGRCRYGYRR